MSQGATPTGQPATQAVVGSPTPSGPAPHGGESRLVSARDQPVDLSGTPIEGWLALGLFWVLGAVVAYQFATRYGLNDSAAWTEEIARYLLVVTVFVGASLGVIANDHIQVDVLYRYLPRRAGRALATLVDGLRVAFFGYLAVLMAQMMLRIGGDPMTVVPLPMNCMYGLIELALCAMTWRSLRLLVEHQRNGRSALERTHEG